jgi:hypothetical protein
MGIYAPIAVTATTILNRSFANAEILVTAAAGLTLTLPAASGLGDEYSFTIGTTVTSNSVIVRVANGTDVMTGTCVQLADAGATVGGYETAADTDTITFNGTTTGGIRGDRIVLRDVAAGLWQVEVVGAATGTEATPFSATVS